MRNWLKSPGATGALAGVSSIEMVKEHAGVRGILEHGEVELGTWRGEWCPGSLHAFSLGPPQCRAGGRQGLQAVGASQTIKHRGGPVSKSTFGRLMGLESEVGVAEGPGGGERVEMLATKRVGESDVPGREVGRPGEWFVLGARPVMRG